MNCVCDYDPADFYSASRPIARKAHKCDECAGQIKRGERYERVNGKWEGCISTFKTCVWCLAVRDAISQRVPCFCWAHGGLDIDVEYALEEAYQYPGLWMRVAHIELERREDKRNA